MDATAGMGAAPVTEMYPRERSGDPRPGGSRELLSGLIHDARNMVSALELYCDLLEEPGVLSSAYGHYAAELRRVGAANRRLLERLSQLDTPQENRASARDARLVRLRSRWESDRWPISAPISAQREDLPAAAQGSLMRSNSRPALTAGKQVENLANELEANRNLLAAMAGPAVTLRMSIQGGAIPVNMCGDDFTRVLVNLVRNAAEAMPGGGHLQIALEEGPEYMTLSFTDSGPGIPKSALESIFSPGYSTHIGFQQAGDAEVCTWPRQHRGLGLSIVRSLVNMAGGAIWAANRIAEAGGSSEKRPSTCGAVFLIEFPIPHAGNGQEQSSKGGSPKRI